jgi:hypothetical protein
MEPYFNDLTPSERCKLLHDSTVRFIVNAHLKNIFPKKKNCILDIRKSTTIYAPSELDEILKEEGWERFDVETNGWQQDTWYYYTHPDYDFDLTMEYSGFYGDLKLYRNDIDD